MSIIANPGISGKDAQAEIDRLIEQNNNTISRLRGNKGAAAPSSTGGVINVTRDANGNLVVGG